MEIWRHDVSHLWLHGANCLAGSGVMWFRLPETKGKSLEQIERELVD